MPAKKGGPRTLAAKGARATSGRRGKTGKPGPKGPRGLSGRVPSAELLEKMVTRFADVYEQLTAHMKEIARLRSELNEIVRNTVNTRS
jgi:hypothetical protein